MELPASPHPAEPPTAHPPSPPPSPPPTPVRAGGYRLEGALGEQLPGGAVSRLGVSLWARREDGGEAFSRAPLPPLHHARYSGALPPVRVLGWAGGLWGQRGTLGVRPWVSPPCPRFLPQLFPSQPKLPELRPSCSLPAGAPSISTTKLGLRGCPGGPGAVLEFLENPENRKQKDEIFTRACEPSRAQGGEGLFARSKCLGGPEVPKRGRVGMRGGQAAPLSSFSAAWAQGGAAEVVGAVHGVAYLSPSSQSIFYQSHWRRNNAVKIASRDGSGRVWYPNSPYKGRLELFPNNTLKISHLQKNDSSRYQVYLEDEVGKEHVDDILLTVYGELGGWEHCPSTP